MGTKEKEEDIVSMSCRHVLRNEFSFDISLDDEKFKNHMNINRSRPSSDLCNDPSVSNKT